MSAPDEQFDDCPRCRFDRHVEEQAAGIRCGQCWALIADVDSNAEGGLCGTCHVTRRDGGRPNRSKWDTEPKGESA